MAAYNHAPYIRAAIDSVLHQEGVDFELLIEDDGSSDETAEVVRSVRDSRLAFFQKTRNEGAYATHNNLLTRARGKYIAVINSDDVWLGSDKLAYQVDVLEGGPEFGATFARPIYIDQHGAMVPPDATFMGRLFEQPNRSQSEWLRRFFVLGNCLCHPTVMIRKTCHDQLGGYDNRLRQIADYEMWLRLIRAKNIHVSERELVAFRWVAGGNTSWPSDTNIVRTRNEEFFVLRNIFNEVPHDLMRSAFRDVLVDPDVSDPLQMEVEKALLFFGVDSHLHRLYESIGLEKIFAMLGNPHFRPILHDYGVDDLWLHERTGEFTPYLERESASRFQSGSIATQPDPSLKSFMTRAFALLRR